MKKEGEIVRQTEVKAKKTDLNHERTVNVEGQNGKHHH